MHIVVAGSVHEEVVSFEFVGEGNRAVVVVTGCVF